MEVKKVCKNCGRPFVSDDRHKIFCCYKCRHAYEQMMKRLNGLPTRQTESEEVNGKPNKKLLSPSQAAKYLGLSRQTLYNYVATGVISCVDLPGRKGQLNDRVEVLAGRKVIAFPDVDGYDTWVQKAAERPHLGIIVSDLLEKNATPEDRAAHIDIADLLIRSIQEQPLPCPPATDNPVFLEVRKYISPEYHAEVMALIEELGLELVGVTETITSDFVQ